MSNYYEDTMPLMTNENEYKKYFIDESLPLFDKLNVIIKKGQPFQRQALLNNLNIYITSSLFKALIEFIISELETWDIDTILLFPKCLHNLLIKNLSSLDNQLFNIIFKHIIIEISSGNEKLSKEYIFYFDIVIEHYTKEFNSENKFPFVIDDDIYEIIFSLGKFGQSAENKRLCCYLSSCLCRIIYYDNENKKIQNLFNRICFLFCDLEKTTESQISRELNYLIPIFKEKILEVNDINQAIKSYINHDSDHIIQATTIISLLNNIKYISNELKELILEKVKEIFDDNNYEDEHKDKILDTIINSLYNECLQNEEKNNEEESNIISINDSYELNEFINKVLNLNFMKNFLNNDKIEPLLIINFDKISLILKNCTLYNYNYNNCCNNCNYQNCYNGEENMVTIDDIFIKIYMKIISKNANNNDDANSSDNENSDKSLKKLFIINLYKIIPCLNSLNNSKCLYEKIIHLFKKESLISILKIYENEFTSNSSCKDSNYLYKFFICLLKQSQIAFNNNNNVNKFISINNNGNNNSNASSTNSVTNENNYYIKLFHNILENIFFYYNQYPKTFTSQIHFLIAKTLQELIEQVFKYFKTFPLNIKERSSIEKMCDKIYDEIFNSYLFNIIKNQKFGNYLKVEYINVFPYLILYGKNRQSYLNFIEEEIINSQQFYTRRYSINFIEQCLNIFSFDFFVKLNLLDILYKLIHDDSNIISASIIEKVLFFLKKIIAFGNDVFQNICKILLKINKLNKDNKSVSIKNFDIEKNRIIKKILNIGMGNNDNYRNIKNPIFNYNKLSESLKEEIKLIKEKETKLMIKENEILGKGNKAILLNLSNSSNVKESESKTDKIKMNLPYSENRINDNNKEENNITPFNYIQKDKNKRRKSWIEKSSSGVVIHNLCSKNTNSKKYLPKLKYNTKKNFSSNNKQCDITFSSHNNLNNNFNNNNNNNNTNKKSGNTLNINKLIINFKDKSPDKKLNLKSIKGHHNRMPSANSSKRESISNCNSNINCKNICSKCDNNIYIYDNNCQVINLNTINQNNIDNNYMRYSGRIPIKNMINNNEFSNNIINGNKSLQNSKNSHFGFKNGLKGMKAKKDNYFNISNKITINAKVNEINKIVNNN